MRSEQQFSNLVYDYFFMRIQFGYYQCGDYLPSIETLCQELDVSAQTVKTALQRLRAEGCIDMHNGRSTKVIFKQDPGRAQEYIYRYFSLRVRDSQDLYQSSGMILMPLLVEGFRQAGPEDLAYLARLADGTTYDDVLHFFCFVLQRIDNPLAMNLYWEASLYCGLLFLKPNEADSLNDLDVLHQFMKRCLRLAKAGDWDRLAECLWDFRRISVGKAVDQITQVISPAPDKEQIPFVWRIYRERPQVCYSLASHLLHEIYVGAYSQASFFPSYEKMSRRYGVSVSTIRRTVKVLNELGAARSINGKGTRIYGIGARCEAPDFSSLAVRRNLAYFVQSFELLAHSCEQVLWDTLTKASREEKDRLLQLLREDMECGRSELSPWRFLLFIAKYSPLRGIREIYGRIYGLFLWGYPLKASRETSPEFVWVTLGFAHEMLQSLSADDAVSCARAMKAYTFRQITIAEKYLLENGLPPEELRMTPVIRLLVTGENSLK